MDTECAICATPLPQHQTPQMYCSQACRNRAAYERSKTKHYGICSVEGCDRGVRGRGLCGMHYARLRRGQPLDAPLQRRPPRPCPVDDCNNTSNGRDDLCNTHRRRKRLYGTEHGTFKTTQVCKVEGCEAEAVPSKRSSEFCRLHFIDWVKAEAVAGRVPTTTDGRGYRYVSIYKKSFALHRVVMEWKLGRPLERFENVHHVNGRRDDNRPENLELWVKPQPAGQRPEDLVAWVVEHYPDLVRAAMT